MTTISCGLFREAIPEPPKLPAMAQQVLQVAPELEEKFRYGSAEERASLAADPACPKAVLALLAKDRPTVVLRVAGNPACPPEVLSDVFERLEAVQEAPRHWPFAHAYRRVLQNPNCPESILRRLFERETGTVASNPHCPKDLIARASRWEDWRIRETAVANPALPADALLIALNDEKAAVAFAARRALLKRDHQTLRDGLLEVNSRARGWMIQQTPEDKITQLARESDPRLRRLAALGTRDRTVLTQLSADANGHVRRAASQRLMAALTGLTY